MRDLAGANDRSLVAVIAAQVRCAEGGIEVARQVTAGTVDPARARQLIGVVEHDGDAHRAALIGRLRRSVTSPIDREDLFRLSRGVDDVLDATRDFVREFDLFGAAPDPLYGPVLDRLAGGLARLDAAVRLLPDAPRRAAEAAAEAKKPGVRPAYQRSVAALMPEAGPRSLVLVLLLGRLDVAGERLAAAADALADGVMKRFQ
ncbi:DUF47 domain-containing protein [Micromonospora eburnea]|uniref:DUF47 family protein n=1 Tax=Micromonospora eburnea TaxID=227316 RepID=A0A1C6UQV9_9ACTN|nr:DUF47 family protein [Micromonospora eburnea]SCL56412.1 hypothetical protein GA0070604_3408 [Micromonospora eburnea]